MRFFRPSVSAVVPVLLLATSASAGDVDPALLRKLRTEPATGSATVIVHLKGQLDLKTLRLSSVPLRSRGRAVATALKQHTLAASERIRNFLSVTDGVEEVTPIWITHSLRVRAPLAVLTQVAAMNAAYDTVTLDEAKEVGEMFDDVGNASIAPRLEKIPSLQQLFPWLSEPTPGRADLPTIGWGIEKLGATEVWANGNQGQGALVAVIDSGANIKHPDLAPNIWKNPGETGSDTNGDDKATNGIDDDGNGFVDDVVGWNFEDKSADVKDENGHGSQAAGIVGGMGAGGTKTGVAPKATLMIVRSCCKHPTKIFESNTWEAIQYAIDNGARAISMSLSAKHPSNPSYAKWRRVGEVELEAGIIHVNSAGNMGGGKEPNNIGAPATNPPAWFHPSQTRGESTSMITIGATDQQDKVRRYTSVGPVSWQNIDEYKDFPYERDGAPGLIKPEVCGPSEVPSTSKDGTSYTRSFGGTSSATPHIAGVVALLLSAKPDLTPAQATEALQNTAVEVESPYNNKCGTGRVDALKAVEYVKTKF